MKIKNSITLLKIVNEKQMHPLVLKDVFDKLSYNDERGFGFQDVSFNEANEIFGLVIKKTPILINSFNNHTQRIEKSETFVYNEIDFHLDFSFEIAEIFASQIDVNKLKAIIKNHIYEYFYLVEISTMIFQILPKLFKLYENLIFHKLVINNFKHSDDVIGKYDAQIYDKNAAWELLKIYEGDVIKSSFSIPIDNDVVAYFAIDNYGRLQVEVEEAFYQKAIDMIKFSI